jgi:hypothetical protein
MRHGSITLREYPASIVRLACDRCDRRGQFRRDRLIEQHAPDIPLPDLRHKLAVGCPLVGHPQTLCGIHYPDLLAAR